jgi:hypothetical protein
MPPSYQLTYRLFLLAFVCVPVLCALSPFKSDTHFRLLGLPVLRAVYSHFPGVFAVISSFWFPLFSHNDIFLLSPLMTLELHVTVIVPDCFDSQVYVSMVTVSFIVGLILTVTLALLEMDEFDFKLTKSSKTNEVSAVTFGALIVALGEPPSVMLADGDDGEVWLHLKFKSLLVTLGSMFEPMSKNFVPTRWAVAI